MVGYGLKLAGVAIALVLAGALAILIFSNIWMKVGIGAAFLVVGGGLLLFAWRVDRKGREAREGLDELPPV
jgi:Flp pilus assembly protein TadB